MTGFLVMKVAIGTLLKKACTAAGSIWWGAVIIGFTLAADVSEFVGRIFWKERK
jgi:hypothetical protein